MLSRLHSNQELPSVFWEVSGRYWDGNARKHSPKGFGDRVGRLYRPESSDLDLSCIHMAKCLGFDPHHSRTWVLTHPRSEQFLQAQVQRRFLVRVRLISVWTEEGLGFKPKSETSFNVLCRCTPRGYGAFCLLFLGSVFAGNLSQGGPRNECIA